MNRRDFLMTSAGTATVMLADFDSASAQAAALPASAPSAAFPFKKKRKTVLGSEMAFVDEGSGQPVVFLHGNPTSSYLWRNIIPYVTGSRRAIAPDLIGMGDSDKPKISYTYDDHAQHLHALLDALDLSDVILVIHDWGSSLGLHYARENPDRIAGLVFMEAMVPPAFPFESYEAMGPFGDLFRTLRTKGPGEQMVLEENFFVETILARMGLWRHRSAPTPCRLIAAPTPHPKAGCQPCNGHARFPIANSPAGVARTVNSNSAWLVQTNIPKLMFYADPGALIPPAAAEWLTDNLKNIETRFLGAGQHFVQEDHPHLIGQGIADWLRRN